MPRVAIMPIQTNLSPLSLIPRPCPFKIISLNNNLAKYILFYYSAYTLLHEYPVKNEGERNYGHEGLTTLFKNGEEGGRGGIGGH